MKDIIKFSDDLTTDKETSRDKQEIELFFIIEDCIELLDTILVYQQINNIDACANRLLFVTYYGIIDKALAYRIIMGLSKLFDSDSNSRTILKVINSFSQTKEFQKADTKKIFEKIIQYNNHLTENYNFKYLRDKFFAHLDKKVRYSSLRLGYQLVELDFLFSDLSCIVNELINLFNICYNEEYPVKPGKEIEIPKVENLVDVEERANKFIETHTYLKNELVIDSKGLHFKK